MGTVNDKLDYLSSTKRLLRESINGVLADRAEPLLTESDLFEDYPSALWASSPVPSAGSLTGTVADKLLRLNETKQRLREAINVELGIGLTESDPFRYFAAKIHPILSLYQNNEQGAWYDPSDLTTLYQDAAGTTPVASDGDPVGLMLDKSGNGNHAIQSVAASRPLNPGLRYDRVDDHFVLPAGLAASQDVFLCGYVAPQVFTGQQDFFELSSKDGRDGVRILVVNNKWYFQAGNSTGRTTIVYDSTASGVLTLHLSAKVMTARINGQQVGQANVPEYAPCTGASYIGASYIEASNGMNNFVSGVAGSMVTVNRSVTESEMINTERYIAQKHGVTLP